MMLLCNFIAIYGRENKNLRTKSASSGGKKSKMKEQKGRASEEINLSALLPAWMEWIMKFNKANKNGKALCVRLGWARSKMRTGGMERKARKATQFRLVFQSFSACAKKADGWRRENKIHRLANAYSSYSIFLPRRAPKKGGKAPSFLAWNLSHLRWSLFSGRRRKHICKREKSWKIMMGVAFLVFVP